MTDWFSQSDFSVRLEWGRYGARRAAERGDILVVVDVLSFSTGVVTAVANGAFIYPCATQTEAMETAELIGGEAAVNRRDVPQKGQFSLSPVHLAQATPGLRITVASPNGATCSQFGASVPVLMIGCLLNANAVAHEIGNAIECYQRPLTVLACGERWKETNEDGELRFALEDLLGAGAIIAALPERFSLSPEAKSAAVTFSALSSDILSVLQNCGSGIELSDKGFAMDVKHAAQTDIYDVVPILAPERYFTLASL